MSKNYSDEELERMDQERADLYAKQHDCSHYNCVVTEWHWSTAKPRMLQCNDCGLEKLIDEDE